jgi:hypothetical protein
MAHARDGIRGRVRPRAECQSFQRQLPRPPPQAGGPVCGDSAGASVRPNTRGPVRNPVLKHRLAPCFPWFLSFGNRTQNSRVAGARPNHQPIGGSDPNHQGIWSPPRVVLCLLLQYRCVCLLLQDLVQSCWRGGGADMGGHVLRETTSRGLCGLGCPSRTSEPVWTRLPIAHHAQPNTKLCAWRIAGLGPGTCRFCF